jgi:cation:H+ antiporter
MQIINTYIESHLPVAWLALAVAFAVLAKSADFFVDSSVALAERFRIPKMVIGIVLVSLATTAPELSVSMMSALAGSPEMALGNAIGSVICNAGLALAVCGLMSRVPVPVTPSVLRTSGGVLLGVGLLAFLCVAFDQTLDRWEGAALVALFLLYMLYLFREQKRGKLTGAVDLEQLEDEVSFPLYRQGLCFAVGLAGILLSSQFVVVSATTIARSAGIPESVIALTLVALGTSIPEVATSVMAALKGEGALSVGNILGANIMNICWVAGASSIANPLSLSRTEILFMFPAMFIVVVATLVVLRSHHKLTRKEGGFLLLLYACYVVSFFFVFKPEVQ